MTLTNMQRMTSLRILTDDKGRHQIIQNVSMLKESILKSYNYMVNIERNGFQVEKVYIQTNINLKRKYGAVHSYSI
jgi:hypothetical protein